MALDIGEALTRKLGPLPAWAWGGVVGVAALGYRALRGPGATGPSSSSGSVPTIGGDGAFDYGDLPDAGGGGGGGTDGTPQIPPIGGDQLPGVIGQISAGFTLQQQLNDALAKLSSLLGQRSTIQNQMNSNLDAYRAHKITKAAYTKKNAQLKSQLATVNTQIGSQNGVIADLKARLAAIFAAPAAA